MNTTRSSACLNALSSSNDRMPNESIPPRIKHHRGFTTRIGPCRSSA
jgi:hypothetical protein